MFGADSFTHLKYVCRETREEEIDWSEDIWSPSLQEDGVSNTSFSNAANSSYWRVASVSPCEIFKAVTGHWLSLSSWQDFNLPLPMKHLNRLHICHKAELAFAYTGPLCTRDLAFWLFAAILIEASMPQVQELPSNLSNSIVFLQN